MPPATRITYGRRRTKIPAESTRDTTVVWDEEEFLATRSPSTPTTLSRVVDVITPSSRDKRRANVDSPSRRSGCSTTPHKSLRASPCPSSLQSSPRSPGLQRTPSSSSQQFNKLLEKHATPLRSTPQKPRSQNSAITPSQSPSRAKTQSPEKPSVANLAPRQKQRAVGTIENKYPPVVTLPSSPSSSRSATPVSEAGTPRKKRILDHPLVLNSPSRVRMLSLSKTKVTYGSHSRPSAIKVEKNTKEVFNDRWDHQEKETYASLRKKWGIDEEEELLEGAEAPDIKSVAQLRAKGENANFVDQIDFIIEGMHESASLPVKRSSALEIIKTINHPDAIRKLKVLGLIERIYDGFRSSNKDLSDFILSFIFALFLSLISKDVSTAKALMNIKSTATTCDVLECFKNILMRNDSEMTLGNYMANLGSGKSTKMEKLVLNHLLDLMPKDSPSPSLESLCMITLAILSSYTPTSSFQPHVSIYSSNLFEMVLSRMSQLAPSAKPMTAVDFHNIELSLSIVEAIQAATVEGNELLLTNHRTSFATYGNIARSCFVTLKTPGNENLADLVTSCLSSVLRLWVELTTQSTAFARYFVEPSHSTILHVLLWLIVYSRTKISHEQGSKKKTSALNNTAMIDILCLSLVILTNVAESQDESRNIIALCEIDPSCTRSECLDASVCACSSANPGSHFIADLCMDSLLEVKSQVSTEFVQAYSRLLLGLILVNSNSESRVELLKRLDSNALEHLKSSLEEFAQLHEQDLKCKPTNLKKLNDSVYTREMKRTGRSLDADKRFIDEMTDMARMIEDYVK